MELEQIMIMLKKQPQTYETILKEDFDNRNTVTNWVRTKFSTWAYKWNLIGYGVLDGTRFGKKIFFAKDKEYLIIITRIKNIFYYFYCDMIEEEGDDFIIMKQAFRLNKYNWDSVGDYKIHNYEIIRWF